MLKQKRIAAAVSLALALSAGSAHAVLERVGPPSTSPSVGGFPAWYEDTTGLAFEFCDPLNAAEVEGGWCLILPADVPTVPEVFPTSFFDEHFYWTAGTGLAHGTQLRGVVTLAMESAFGAGPAVPGDQITFARIRLVYTPIPVTGTYRFIHPFGEDLIEAVAGDRIFFTEDVAVPCPTGFDCPLNGRLGPFLLPSDFPGGPEHAPLTATNPTPDTNPAHFGGAFVPSPYPGTGRAYIADPGRSGPVTGSPLPNFIDSSGASRNHNMVRLEGPPGSNLGGPGIDFLESTNFDLMGRIYTGPMPGQVNVERASYTRSAAGNQLDIIATAVGSASGRFPGQPRPGGATPQLSFFDAPCAGVVDALGNIRPPFSAPAGATETQMFATGNRHFGQTTPAVIPAAVCVKDASARDASGNLVPTYTRARVTDEVAISQAMFDPSAGSLTVAASSSDAMLPPTLSLAYGTFRGDLATGRIVVPGLVAPPANVRVLSSAGGTNRAQVSTGVATGGVPVPAGTPVALADTYTFLEDAGAQLLTPLANDTNVAGGILAMTSLPRLGTAVLNPDQTVTYTANPNVSGADGFTYTVTVGTQVSNTGTVTLNITPVNDLPVAANDSTSTLVNVPVTINVLANDTDPDGAADIVAVANVTQPTPAGASTTVVGRTVTFNATAGGTYSFTYQAQDAAGALSATPGRVTVTVAAAETLLFAKSEYVRSGGGLRVEGSVAPATGQSITVEFVNATGTVLGLAGTTTAAAGGSWAVKASGVILPLGTTAVKATSSNGAVRTTTLVIK